MRSMPDLFSNLVIKSTVVSCRISAISRCCNSFSLPVDANYLTDHCSLWFERYFYWNRNWAFPFILAMALLLVDHFHLLCYWDKFTELLLSKKIWKLWTKQGPFCSRKYSSGTGIHFLLSCIPSFELLSCTRELFLLNAFAQTQSPLEVGHWKQI